MGAAGGQTGRLEGRKAVDISVTASEGANVTVVSVGGEIDVYTAPILREALDKQIALGHGNLIVDLDDVSFMDSTGLGVLVGRLKRVRGQSGSLRLVCTQERVLKVFKITGLDKVFAIYDSLVEARAAATKAPT
jgi:anti-sigma B factor antagonist